jgi:hypothetical protein
MDKDYLFLDCEIIKNRAAYLIMKYQYLFIILLFLIACGNPAKKETANEPETVFNQSLAEELKSMAVVDQIAAYIPQGEYQKLSKEEWQTFKDSVFTTHQIRLQQIFDEYGFVGFDLAVEEGSQNFWLMVQHSDHNPEFQKAVLEKMKVEVTKKNAIPSNYALLTDRVLLNTGKQQLYGTQVSYNMETGQAYPRNLADSVNVNERRKNMEMEPLEVYLNGMIEMHFDMNKDYYLKKGVTEPTFYEVPK